MAKYPVYLELAGKKVLVIGAGTVAAAKVQPLIAAGAKVTVVAKRIAPALEKACARNDIEIIKEEYSKIYLASTTLAIAATNDRQLNGQIRRDCRELKVLCNVVDDPELCDFFVPAVVKRGNLQIAIGTDGACPAYARHIRKKLEKIFTEDHGRFIEELEKARAKLIGCIDDGDKRKAILEELVTDESFEYFVKNGPEAWHSRAEKIIAEQRPR